MLATTPSPPLSFNARTRGVRLRLPAGAWRAGLLALSAWLMVGLPAGEASAAQLPVHPARVDCRLSRVPAPVPVPPITAPPRTPAWHYQYAVAERIMFGLPATRRAIEAAAADRFSSDTDLGTPLTSAEHRQLLAAERFGLHVDAVSRAAQRALPGAFAGAWFEYPGGGTIYVAFTSHACPSQQLRLRLAQIASGRTVAVPAARDATVTRLTALACAVNRDTARLRHRGVIINRTEIDTPGDRFLVTLDPSSVPRAQAIITARYGSRGLAFTRPAPPARAADARNDTAHARSHTPRTRMYASPSPAAAAAAAAPFLIHAHALAQGDSP